jgi:glycosyltransferase involved in cell wall biosynthesis
VALSSTQESQLKQNALLSRRVRKVVNSQPISILDRENSRVALRARFSLPPDSQVVVWGGRLSPEKGAVDFVEAASALGEANVQFLLFGSGAQEAMIAGLIRDSGKQNIRLVGFQADFTELLAGADLLVNSSHREQTPNVVLEAMARHVPVIATRVGAIAELSGPDSAIRMVERGDVANMAAGIRELLRDSGERQRMVEAARRRIETDFSIAEQARQYRELLAEARDA